MKGFILKKIILAVITLWLTATLTFILMHSLPGSPFVSVKALPRYTVGVLKAAYGLDQPLYRQYFRYMGNLIHLDFGRSMVYPGKTVNSIILSSFPVSLDLGLKAYLLIIFTGTGLGILSCVRKGGLLDGIIQTVSIIAVSVPGFVIAVLFQYFFCYTLSMFLKRSMGWDFMLLPLTGWGSARHTVIPVLSLAAGAAGFVARMTRTSIAEVLKKDYIITAYSKGLNYRQVLTRHALKNALIPVMAISGPIAVSLLLGSFVVENIFSIPGLGRYFVYSIREKDYTMIMGLAVFTALVSIIINTVLDIAYYIIDPKTRETQNINRY